MQCRGTYYGGKGSAISIVSNDGRDRATARGPCPRPATKKAAPGVRLERPGRTSTPIDCARIGKHVGGCNVVSERPRPDRDCGGCDLTLDAILGSSRVIRAALAKFYTSRRNGDRCRLHSGGNRPGGGRVSSRRLSVCRMGSNAVRMP